MASKKQMGLERFTPLLVIVSIILAFAVGVLWQKVDNLEGGGGSKGTTAQAPSAGSGAAPESNLSDLASLAEQAGVDKDDFQECYDSGKYADKVEEVYQGGLAAGVTGTPGNFIVNKNGDTWFIPGAYPYEQIKPIIDLALGNSDGAADPTIQKLDAETAATLPEVTGDDFMRGSGNPDVYLVEYSDFQCPYCQRFHSTGLQVINEYDNVAWVYRHFPLDQLHPYARPAAEASECVAELGGTEAFWNFADLAFGS